MSKITKQNPRRGSSFDDFLKEDDLYEGVVAEVAKRNFIRSVIEEMEKNHITQAAMAVGKRLRIDLVEANA